MTNLKAKANDFILILIKLRKQVNKKKKKILNVLVFLVLIFGFLLLPLFLNTYLI